MQINSFFWRLVLGCTSAVALCVAGLYWLWLQQLSVTELSALVACVLAGLWWWIYQLIQPIQKVNAAITDGILALKDNDFSISIHDKGYRETTHVVTAYNQLTEVLRQERLTINQRELLLEKVIQSAPMALVLTNGKHVVYSNVSSRELFAVKGKLEGLDFDALCDALPPELKNVTNLQQEGLVSFSDGDLSVVYQFQFQEFRLHGRGHFLYLYQNLSRVMSRKEIELWKQLIRLISHEINNSLAPIQSLTHSAKSILQQPEHLPMLEGILDTISNRSEHLHTFIEQYIQYAKLPAPEKTAVVLQDFHQKLHTLLGVQSVLDCATKTALFDETQIEQVMLNLVKNAKESGSDIADVGFEIRQTANQLSFVVYDRGNGMTETQLSQALLPFYTTKPKGTGIGLTLCNEIIAAHDGRLRLYNRDHGGLCVSFVLSI